jgi:hypothetical protein
MTNNETRDQWIKRMTALLDEVERSPQYKSMGDPESREGLAHFRGLVATVERKRPSQEDFEWFMRTYARAWKQFIRATAH